MKTILSIAAIALLGATVVGCEETSDTKQRDAQEQILKEATSQTGMPAIKNFRERKLMKQIIEMRDQEGLVTYTYTFPEVSGIPVFLCNSVGYGLPAAMQYTNPQKYLWKGDGHMMPQADPNGLFSPESAEGTWVLCSDPSGKGKTKPVYVEPRIIVSPFKL
jgi:hypothetical protein